MRKTLADRLAEAIASGGYAGYFPIFPGTVGSVVGIALYAILLRLGLLTEHFSAAWPITLGAVLAVGTISAHRCEKIFGHDHRRIVIDEVWGMLIAVFLVPPRWPWILAGFLVFRLLDIAKPFPARRAERIGGGLAIMLDDGVAGIYTVLVLHLARALLG